MDDSPWMYRCFVVQKHHSIVLLISAASSHHWQARLHQAALCLELFTACFAMPCALRSMKGILCAQACP
jgi:hypothetical protein